MHRAMTSERECYVYIVLPDATEFVTAGRFRWTDDGAGGFGDFVYGRTYRARADALELDPVELRLSERICETTRMGGFFGAIRDSTPDSWGRRVIERLACREDLTGFDFLMLGPDDPAGALAFGRDAAPPEPRRRFNQAADLPRLQQTVDEIIEPDPDHRDHAEDLLPLATSMGGARPKAVVEDEDASMGRQVHPRRRPLEPSARRAWRPSACAGMRP